MKKKILIIEDEADIVTEIEFILTKKGYDVIKALDGQQGVLLAKEQEPDLIILDFCLPMLNGKEVAEQLKADERLKNIPIILLTASTDNIEEKAKECGAKSYIFKPFDYKQLIENIEFQFRQETGK